MTSCPRPFPELDQITDSVLVLVVDHPFVVLESRRRRSWSRRIPAFAEDRMVPLGSLGVAKFAWGKMGIPENHVIDQHESMSSGNGATALRPNGTRERRILCRFLNIVGVIKGSTTKECPVDYHAFQVLRQDQPLAKYRRDVA